MARHAVLLTVVGAALVVALMFWLDALEIQRMPPRGSAGLWPVRILTDFGKSEFVLWLLAATMVFGIKINFINFVAFPITFGIGVDYAVNVMARYLRDGARNIGAAVRGTRGAVGLCSLTTIIGYSSLLVAQNVGLFLFGLLAVLGEIACLTTAVVVLPSVILLLRPAKNAVPPQFEWDAATVPAPVDPTAGTSSSHSAQS